MKNISVPPASVRPRYQLLDGLRGVAAFVVILYHFGEGFATSAVDMMMNHGYLAVDFFFVLSGFVIGYAYDRRWSAQHMTRRTFMLRRIIRLQPMVILGAVLGLIAYIIAGCERWDGTQMPGWTVAVAFVLAMLVLPVIPGTSADVRGNNEMFPINGPEWSLFFEYIGSLLYALVLHRLGKRALGAVIVVSAIGLTACALGDISGGYTTGFGWSIDANGLPWMGFVGGFFHVGFSFSTGLLMSRGFRKRNIRGAFWLCSALIVAVCICPYVTGDGGPSVMNAVYDVAVTVFILPTIVYLGASGQTTDRFSTLICEGLGQLSYPVYIIHYPLMYLFYGWVWSNGVAFGDALPVCGAILVAIPVMAFVALRYYDEPVRAWLARKWL